jgi:hypothetical protein
MAKKDLVWSERRRNERKREKERLPISPQLPAHKSPTKISNQAAI